MASGESNATARYLAGVSVSALGVLLLLVPLSDIYDDLTDLSWGVVWTVVENSAMLLLALGLVGAGTWLVRSDWETQYVVTVAEWTLVVTGLIAALFGWVVAIQVSSWISRSRSCSRSTGSSSAVSRPSGSASTAPASG